MGFTLIDFSQQLLLEILTIWTDLGGGNAVSESTSW